MRIGNSPAGSRAYQGIIDEVRIWSRALDENEINFQMVRGAEILSVDPSAKVAVTWGLLKNY
ncbi:MAG: LamG protein [Candidatus Poribacteria bacterium]|nr:LamG protein [Candidatus Poribacteria bacterium]